MKKAIILGWVVALFVGLFACEGEHLTATTYDVYFRSEQGAFLDGALHPERCTVLEGESPTDVLLARLLTGPTEEGSLRSIPEGVVTNGWKLEDGTLTVDFSRRYSTLGGIDLTLADYSVTMTLSQLPGVTSVVTTVEGDVISYRERQTLRSTDATLSLHRTSPVQRQVTLFVPTFGKDGAVQCKEEVCLLILKEDETLTTNILYALIDAAEAAGFTGMPAKSDVISAEVQEGLCSLNLVESFYELAHESERVNYAVLGCLVDSLCGLEHVTGVRFLKEGEPAQSYGGIYMQGDIMDDTYFTQEALAVREEE